MDFPIVNYPTNAETDPGVLYRSLGSFWTQIFRDQATLRGYTLALAEEIIQRYYDLVEVVNSYSVKDTPIFHKEKWKPIRILRSRFGTAPFVFESGHAVFGPQAENDQYYQKVIFQFGFPKRPSANVYLVNVGDELKDFGVITDRIFNPSKYYFKGSDVVVQDGILYFNSDIFNDEKIAKSNVISENGEVVQFLDTSGVLQDEQLIVLWVYHADVDQSILTNNFANLFELDLKNDQTLKGILKAIFDLFVDGPNVINIKSICAAFLGISPIIETIETVEDVFSDEVNQFVVTDRHVYKFALDQTLLTTVKNGAEFLAGDMLVDTIEYYDNAVTPGWWKSSKTIRNKLALSQYLFLGNYESQIIVPNTLDLVTVNSNGDIVFPIEGSAKDVETFHTHLNNSKETIKPLMNLGGPGSSQPIQPVDFLMENFLKTNTAFMRFRFGTHDLQSRFLSLLPLLYSQLPPYVYVIFDLDLVVEDETYDKLNNSNLFHFDDDVTLSADGSNSAGYIEPLSPYNYNNAKERLFSISLGIPIQAYEVVYGSGHSGSPTARDGTLLNTHPSGSSTASFGKLLLLDFYS